MDESPVHHKLQDNGRFLKFKMLLLIRNTIDVVFQRICAIFWYNGLYNDKSAKFGTKEADIIWINNRTGGILKLPYFWQNFNIPILHKGF